MTSAVRLAHSMMLILLAGTLLARTEVSSDASLRGLIVTPTGAVWASGSKATILRSASQHSRFQKCTEPPDAAGLDFRGIYAWSSSHALIMSSGTGPLSRIYETTDGCATWRLLLANPDAQGFWDAVTFYPRSPQGALLGDPVNGAFTIFRTLDGGHHWQRDNDPLLASKPPNEGSFAASNSALVIVSAAGDLLFGTGGLGGPRIFRFDGRRKAWSSVALPIASNATSGIFSIACRSTSVCMAVGGDYKQPNREEGTAFLTIDGGRSWRATATSALGYRSSVAWSDGRWIVAGPTGAEFSRDNGSHWTALSRESWNALSRDWAAGPKGRVQRLAAH